jgi:hypothetical protein
MSEKEKLPLRRRIFRAIIWLVLLTLILGGGVAYAVGWITFQRDEGTLTIQIRTGKVKQAADTAVKQGKDAAAETGQALQKAGKHLEDAADDGDPSKSE